MQLIIDRERQISEVQQDFSNAYPFLKIEFFRNGMKRQSRYPANLKIGSHARLKESWVWKKDNGSLDFDDAMTVLELEEAFMDQFGLSVQVFRKSGNIWLETTMTDHWSLKRQNDHGKEISGGIRGVDRAGDKDFELDRDQD